MHIGRKIKELRKLRKISLSQLAQESGIQIATLSRIENHKMVGTLDSHMKIAKALRVSLPQLYSEVIKETSKTAVQTPQTLTNVFVHNELTTAEILTNDVLLKKMMPSLIKIAPGGETAPEQNAMGTEKFLFVLEGKIEVKVGEERYVLSKSHTLYFDASLPHHLINIGKSLARVLCVVTPMAL